MKWVLFTGTWRLFNEEVETDVRTSTREVLARGDGIITGGATGVDYFVMDEAMKIDPIAMRLRVIIPAYLESYIRDYYTNWCMKPVTKEIIDALAILLRKIKKVNTDALLEMPYDVITQDHYNMRNDEEITQSDSVHAFQVNKSTGTQDTLNKAKKAGIPIDVYKKYTI
ncbi:MAG TPA: hypothetical protein VJH70_02795 [Candidatus Paceibacterota bacterium]